MMMGMAMAERSDNNGDDNVDRDGDDNDDGGAE